MMPSSGPSNVDEVMLVGGSTRMPRAQQIAKEIFGKGRTRTSIPTRWWRWGRCRPGRRADRRSQGSPAPAT